MNYKPVLDDAMKLTIGNSQYGRDPEQDSYDRTLRNYQKLLYQKSAPQYKMYNLPEGKGLKKTIKAKYEMTNGDKIPKDLLYAKLAKMGSIPHSVALDTALGNAIKPKYIQAYPKYFAKGQGLRLTPKVAKNLMMNPSKYNLSSQEIDSLERQRQASYERLAKKGLIKPDKFAKYTSDSFNYMSPEKFKLIALENLKKARAARTAKKIAKQEALLSGPTGNAIRATRTLTDKIRADPERFDIDEKELKKINKYLLKEYAKKRSKGVKITNPDDYEYILPKAARALRLERQSKAAAEYMSPPEEISPMDLPEFQEGGLMTARAIKGKPANPRSINAVKTMARPIILAGIKSIYKKYGLPYIAKPVLLTPKKPLNAKDFWRVLYQTVHGSLLTNFKDHPDAQQAVNEFVETHKNALLGFDAEDVNYKKKQLILSTILGKLVPKGKARKEIMAALPAEKIDGGSVMGILASIAKSPITRKIASSAAKAIMPVLHEKISSLISGKTKNILRAGADQLLGPSQTVQNVPPPQMPMTTMSPPAPTEQIVPTPMKTTMMSGGSTADLYGRRARQAGAVYTMAKKMGSG